ncbi:sodium:solute symporter family protein [Litchfieldia alkalitelluris]|uniref:sodium:solute symporter family protein n=1 Tax=Litchfieldia alkalitelluris TaxID=304268 RepID=UPI0009982920|nr:sodium:solute symporter family protein [Litchfieldia alkalitelluris]
MASLDWVVIIFYLLIMVGIGIWSFKMIKGSDDYFVAGGKLPWWLSGASHHVSGYSGVVFSAYAGIAYSFGFTIYMWWAVAITISVITGAYLIAPRWARLRMKLKIESPLEYLSIRYNMPTQQLMAWSGVVLKLFDVGAKWTAIAILLNGFTGVPLIYGILISGGVSLLYITVGGLWADVWNDFVQFAVQIIAGLVMFFVVISKLGGVSSIFTMWGELPAGNADLFREPYTVAFFIAFIFITFFSYNGGTWNLAQRYIASPSGSEAKKSALFSGVLYLIWPLIMFFPMWAAPIFFPSLDDPNQVYSIMTIEFLPVGLVGLVLASLFAATMSMTSGDINTVSAVITKDILPTISSKVRTLDKKASLKLARIITLIFTGLTLLLGMNADHFGGVLGLIISWFGALVGPISIPMLLGLLPRFKHSNSAAAIGSIIAGLITFVVFKYGLSEVAQSISISAPLAISLITYIGMGWLNRNQPVPQEVEDLLDALSDENTPFTDNSIKA